MIKWLGITSIASLLLFSTSAYAVDTYDATTGQLTIPFVLVGNSTYTNTVVTLGSVVSIGRGAAVGTVDTYDAATGQLIIPSVLVGNTTYTNVIITVGPVISSSGATYAGNAYYYVYQSYADADANIDYMERGTIILDATATITPSQAWDRTTASLANGGIVTALHLRPAVSEALTMIPGGSWLMPTSSLGANISADGLIFAGANIQAGATSNNIIYGVKKPATNVTQADLAGKVFDFTSQGSGFNNAAFVEKTQAGGNLTFSNAAQTLTLVQLESVNGVLGTPITTRNIAYTITTDGLIRIATPATNDVLYIAMSEGLKYAVWSEANYEATNNVRTFKSTGFAIARSATVPTVANLSYNSFASYFATSGPWSPTPVNGGPTVDNIAYTFDSTETATTLSTGYSLQQIQAANAARSCGSSLGLPACLFLANDTITLTGTANGAMTMTISSAGNGRSTTSSGFASADGNVISFPGTIFIKK